MKFFFGFVLGLVVVVFLIQNTQPVEIVFLWWKLAVSRALIVLVFLGIGIGIGYLVRSFRRRSK